MSSSLRFAVSLTVLVLAFAGCASPSAHAPGTGGAAVAGATATGSSGGAPVPEEPEGPLGSPEVRGTWVVAATTATPAAVKSILAENRAWHANSIFVQVRSRGDAWFKPAIEPPPPALVASGFDPLAAMIAGAGRSEVHAWMNMDLIADAKAMPTDHRHVVFTHPEWLMVPEALAASLNARSPQDAGYVTALRDYALAHSTEVEGVFADPANPGYRTYVAQVVGDLCTRYAVAGVHLDYIRYPNPTFGFSRTALELFRAAVDAEITITARTEMASKVKKDVLAYPHQYPQRFAQFRRDAVTALVDEVGRAARAARGGVLISAAVFPDLTDAREKRFQDWRLWLGRGLIDAACPMIYSTNSTIFTQQVRAAVAARGGGRIWAGMGAWKLTAAEIARRVEVIRAAGGDGLVLFSHQGVKDVAGAADALKNGPFFRRAHRLPD